MSLWSKDHIEQQPASRPTNANNSAVGAVVNSQLPKLPPTVVFSYVPPANENVQSNGSATNGSSSAPPAGVKAEDKMDEEDDTPGPNIVFKPIVNDNNYIPVTTGGNSNYNNNNSNTNTRSNNNNNNNDYEQMELIDDDD